MPVVAAAQPIKAALREAAAQVEVAMQAQPAVIIPVRQERPTRAVVAAERISNQAMPLAAQAAPAS